MKFVSLVSKFIQDVATDKSGAAGDRNIQGSLALIWLKVESGDDKSSGKF